MGTTIYLEGRVLKQVHQCRHVTPSIGSDRQAASQLPVAPQIEISMATEQSSEPLNDIRLEQSLEVAMKIILRRANAIHSPLIPD